MFTIRNAQLEALENDQLRRFKDRVAEHIGQFFPARCVELGENGVQEWIQVGIGRARGYEIVTERDVCKYINLMFVFGKDFDKNPATAWAAPLLQASPVDSARKMEYLLRAAKSALERGWLDDHSR